MEDGTMKGDKNQRESFVAYRSFEKKKLPDAQRLQYYDALFAYGLRQEQPDFQGDVMLECIWECVTPQIDANQQRYLNGLKGGPPAGSRNNPSGRRGKRTNQKLTENLPNENENVNENGNATLFGDVEGDAPAKQHTSKRFAKPTLQEVQQYCASRHNGIDAAKFIDHYDSVGWKIGKAPMKDWKAAVRTWERNRQDTSTGKPQPQRREARQLSKDDLV